MQKQNARQSGRGVVLRSCVHHTTTIEPLHAFLDAMRAEGITPSNLDAITPGGTLCRFHVDGDRNGTRNGWAILHIDGLPTGCFGSWKLGVTHTWSTKPRESMSQAERAAFRARIEAARAAREREERQRHAEAAQRAARIWRESRAADPSHGYLISKGVQPLGARRHGDSLVLPVLDFDGKLASLQFIDPEGRKLLLSGGAKRGNFIPVHGEIPARRLLICEGWATGATLASWEPAACVLAAIDAGNLQAVAVGARLRWPTAPIVICCDADPVGLSKGRAAAIASGALVAAPTFPAGAKGSDFNDLAAAIERGHA